MNYIGALLLIFFSEIKKNICYETRGKMGFAGFKKNSR